MKPVYILIADLFCFLIGLIPRIWVRRIGSLLGILWYDIFRIRRQVIDSNLDIAFPNIEKSEKEKIARMSTYNMGANFLEAFLVPSMNSDWLGQEIKIYGLENLQRAKLHKKGVLLLGMHLGNGDLTASALQLAGENIHLISKFFRSKIANDIWFYVRAAKGVQFIEPHGEKTAFTILKALKKNECVVFVIDQFMGRPYAVENYFFGRKTGTAYGLALFALKTQAPVLPIYSFQGDDKKIHIQIGASIDFAGLITENKDENIYKLTQKFNDVVEECIRKHPNEWMWVHRRWKEYE